MILANRLSAEFARDNQIPYLYRAQPKTESQPTNENYDRTQKGPAADYHARLKLKRSMTSTTPQGHASLGLNVYAQVTSPIRRYADILNQRQLIAFLKKEALPYSAAELIRIAEQLEEPLGHARTVSRESRKFWTLRYIEQLLPSNPIFHGTVLRTDLRHPLIEVAELFTTFIIPMKKRKQIGDVVKVSVQKVSAKEDLIQFCEV